MDDAKLNELAESIRAQGVIQPIVVRDLGGRSYEIIAGERRWRASRLAGLAEIPVVVREVDDRTVIAMALIENIQREDLTRSEERREGQEGVSTCRSWWVQHPYKKTTGESRQSHDYKRR